MRRLLVVSAVLLQLVVLMVLAGRRELIRQGGERIYLRTSPIDPRDAFRGDYVTLTYDLGWQPTRALRGTLAEHLGEKDYPVYALLREGERGVFALDYLTDERPQEGRYLTGRLQRDYRVGASVRYGIERLYVEQGRGREIEERLGERNTLQVPMEVEVAVGARGVGVVRGHRFSDLGIQLEVLRTGRTPGITSPPSDPAGGGVGSEGVVPPAQSPLVRVTLQNVSAEPLWLVDYGDRCAFSLVSAEQNAVDIETVSSGCEDPADAAMAWIPLAPGAGHAVTVDLDEPRWYVKVGEEVGAMGERGEWLAFRLVYTTPAVAADPPDAGRLWRGEMPTPTFTNLGRID